MIWPFTSNKSKTLRTRNAERNLPLYDFHSHLLWGLDDGARTFRETTLMLAQYASLGYQGVVATPHTNHYMFESPHLAMLESRAIELREVIDSTGVKVRMGGEIMLRDDYIAGFERGAFQGVQNTFLVEFENRPFVMNDVFEKVLFDFQMQGRQLVLAHPERYPDVHNNPSLVTSFKTRGMLIQVNLRSLTGWNGPRATELAWQFVKTGVADIVGSDLHSLQDFAAISEALDDLEAFDTELFEYLTSINPGHLFHGRTHLIEERS